MKAQTKGTGGGSAAGTGAATAGAPAGTLSISVVIPVYNRENTLGYCLRSVLSQSHPPTEVIVVDDGSTDASLHVAQGFGDPRIRCIALDGNRGAQAARNRGIAEAKGEWIAFQDSDDEWEPERLARGVQELRAHGFDPLTVIHSDCWRYEHDRKRKKSWKLPLVAGADAYRTILAAPGPMFQGMLVSRRLLQEIGGLDDALPAYQEWDTAIRLARVGKMVHLRENLFTYHLHCGETISHDSRKAVQGFWRIVRKNRDEIVRERGRFRFSVMASKAFVRAMTGKYHDIALQVTEETLFHPAISKLLRRTVLLFGGAGPGSE